MKVVVQVNKGTADDFARIFNNVRNLKRQLKEELTDCEVVLFGEGINAVMVGDESLQQVISELQEQGIDIILCSNTLSKKQVDLKDLQCQVQAAGSGVAHIVKRQAEGWAYLAL